MIVGGLAVLLVHLLVLDNAARHLAAGPEPTLGTQVFTTRTLRPPAAPVAPPSPVAEQPPAPPPPKPPAATSPPARPPATPAVAAPAPLVAASAPAPSRTEPPPPDPAPVAEAPPAAPAAPASTPQPVPVAAAPVPPVPPVPSPAAAATVPPLAHDPALEARTYAIPGSVLLRFNATGQRGPQPQQASGSMSWQHDGKQYVARMEIGAFGLGARTFSSTGALTADGLAPQRFADRRRTEVAAHFDREQARVVFSANTPTVTLQPGAQDQLSIFIQLAAMVGGEPQRFTPGRQIALQTVGPRTAETWTFTVEPTETLQLPGGTLSALKLVRLPSQDYDQKVELWLAPELSYLPARIRISFANGDYVDQQWRASSKP